MCSSVSLFCADCTGVCGGRASAPRAQSPPSCSGAAFLRPARSAAPLFCGVDAWSAAGGRGSGARTSALCVDGLFRVGRAVRLVRSSVSLFCADGRGSAASFGALGRSVTCPPSRPEGVGGKRSRPQKPLRCVGVFPAECAHCFFALKPPAAVFGLLCITYVRARVRAFCFFSRGGFSSPPRLQGLAVEVGKIVCNPSSFCFPETPRFLRKGERANIAALSGGDLSETQRIKATNQPKPTCTQNFVYKKAPALTKSEGFERISPKKATCKRLKWALTPPAVIQDRQGEG